MKYYFTFSLLFILFLQSCHEGNQLPITHMEFYWDQTGCADPWNTNSNNSNAETQKAIEDYLKDEGVKGAKVVSITQDGIQLDCFACSCTTGKRFNLTVPRNQKNKMIALGFKESN